MKLKRIVATTLIFAMLLSVCACEKGNMLDNHYNYDALQYVKLGQYENIVIEHEDPSATEEEVQAVVDKLLSENATWVETTRDEVQQGDKVTIDYQGYLQGTSYDGMKEENIEFEIGSETFYKDFEQALIGRKVDADDDFWLKITFPTDFVSGGIAGKTVDYIVCIKSIKAKVLPEFTDEFIKEKSDGKYATTQAYKDYVASTLTEKNKQAIAAKFSSDVWNKVLDNAQIISYPEDRMAYYEEETTAYLKKTWKESFSGEYEHFIEVYLGMGYDEYLKQVKEKCEKMLKEELVLLAIAREQGITLEWSDYKKRARNYLESYDCTSIHELEKVVSRGEICLAIINEDVNNKLLESAISKVKQSED